MNSSGTVNYVDQPSYSRPLHHPYSHPPNIRPLSSRVSIYWVGVLKSYEHVKYI